MEIVNLSLDNIDKENIYCALSEKKGEKTSSLKKLWIRDRFNYGLVFKKFNVSGKAFIKYIPAENAWAPIYADGYMYKINSKEEAQNAPTAFTTYGLFINGKLHTNEIATEDKFLKLIFDKN